MALRKKIEAIVNTHVSMKQEQDAVLLEAFSFTGKFEDGRLAPCEEDEAEFACVVLPGIAIGSNAQGRYTMPLDNWRDTLKNPPRNWAVAGYMTIMEVFVGGVSYQEETVGFVGKDCSDTRMSYRVNPVDGHSQLSQVVAELMEQVVEQHWGFHRGFHKLSVDKAQSSLNSFSSAVGMNIPIRLNLKDSGFEAGNTTGDSSWRTLVGKEASASTGEVKNGSKGMNVKRPNERMSESEARQAMNDF